MGGQSSRAIFTDIVTQLKTTDVDPNDHDFWDDLWKTTLNVDDIFELIQPEDVRLLIEDRPNNLKTLFTQAVAQLYQVVETPYPVYFDQALNCARILSRVLPFMLESNSKFVKELFWTRQQVPKPKASGGGGADAAAAPGTSSTAAAAEGATEAAGGDGGEDVQESEPVAVILVNAIFHLLFLPDFTIEDPNMDFAEEDLSSPEFKSALMWAPGVGSTEKSVVTSTAYDKNRIDVLRVMIAAFCDALYQVPDAYDSCASMWLEVATSCDSPYAEIVFYSLMNTVLGYDPVGWGMPYGNLVSTDTAKPLMEAAVQALIVLLDYGHPIRPPHLNGNGGVGSGADGTASAGPPLPYVSADETDSQGFNVFRRIMSTVEDPAQLNFIFRGFVRLLNNVPQAEASYLPYSITRVGIEQELLVLLWKCLEEIPKFMPYILRHCDVTEILVPVCYFMLEGRRDPSKVGLMYLCTFTLLKLSGERNFGVSLNKPYSLRLPVDVPLFSGNHTDLLVIVLHKMIVSGLEKLSALYNCFLTIICNVSPYCKALSTVASVKLVNLFQLFTSPRFLYANEGNHVYVAMLLETLNNIVQYQYEGNVNIVYAIVRRKEIFESLAALTLPAAISGAAELAAKRQARAEEKGKEANGKAGGGATAAAGGKKNKADEDSEPSSNPMPTELVSTTSVVEREREDGESGEVEAVSAKGPLSSGASSSSSSASSSSSSASSSAGRFVPTQAWLDEVKAELPLNTIMRLLRHLVPQVDELAAAGGVDEMQVLDFIRQTTMVGLLPVPHPIVIRKYQPNKYTCLWFTAFQWGVIFMHNQQVPLFDGKVYIRTLTLSLKRH